MQWGPKDGTFAAVGGAPGPYNTEWLWQINGDAGSAYINGGCSANGADSIGGDSTAASLGLYAGDSSGSGDSVVVFRPGPYVLERVVRKWENTKVTGWSEDSVHFNVLNGPGKCPHKGDTGHFPAFPYINQYDAGAKLGLPKSFNDAGGNACGPSALLMGMLRSLNGIRRSTLPTLTTVFDATMQITSGSQVDNADNNFVAGKAVTFLKKRGWKNTALWKLGSDEPSTRDADPSLGPDPSNEARIDAALQRGPVVISTALSVRQWGKAGGGHIILIEGIDPKHPGEYIVDDPSGNYFASPDKGQYPAGHYGKGSCGYQVDYPKAWVLAFTTGRYLIAMGRHTPARRGQR